jgi:hypothetical protein
MAEVKDILQEYVATANNPQYKSDWNTINSKFPELKGYDAKLLQEYVATANNPKYNSNFETINSKFPELFNTQQKKQTQTTTNGIGVLKKQLPFKAVTDFQQSIVDLAVPNKNTENNPIIGIGTPMEKKKQEPKLEMVYSATEKQLVPKYTEAPKTSAYDVANAMSTEQLLYANNDVFKGVVSQANGDTGLDEFNQQSDKNNNIQAFNRESELYNVRVKTLKERAGNLERVLASKYQTPDFMEQVKSQMATVKQKSQQYDAYVQSRSKEVIALQTELEAIVEQGKTGAQPIEVLKPAYDAKKAQLDAIQRDDEQKRGEIEQLQNDFNGKLDDPDFALYSQIYDKINELSGEQQGLISKPEFAEYRKLLDEGDKAQAKKDAMKKAYQSKGILGKAVDIYAGIGMATNPAAYFLDNGEQVDKTFIGAKIADEGDKLLGRTVKALASISKMSENVNPIGDENKYDVFDKMFDQAVMFSKKRDILNPTATDVQRDIIQKYADVDGYRVMLDENGKPTNDVRDASFYKVNDKTQKEITDKYNENPKAYKTESDFSFSTLITKTTPTILDMGTMMAVTALTGGSSAVMVGTAAAQMYGDMYESGLNAGLTPQEANDFATLTSIMIGMVSLVNPMEANIVKGTASKSIGKFISNSISKADVQLIRSGKMSIGQYVKRMAKEGVKNTFGENLEELVLEPAVQRAIETYYNTKAQKNGQQGFEDLNKPFFDTKQTIETAMITTMASLLMTPIEVANSVPEQRKIALQNALDNPQQFVDMRQKMLEDGDIEKGKFDYEVKAFEEISKQYNTVKPNIKEDLHDDLAELLLKKYTLKNTMSHVNDEVLNKKNQLLLDDINKRLEEVADGTYNKGKEKALSNIANPNTLIEEDKVATYNGAEVTILDDLADGEVVINTNNPEIGEDGIITVEKSALTDVRNKPKDIEQLQITSAVININGKEYEGKNHAEAILKAQADGQDISQVDRQAEGLFKLSDGTIINREQAKEQFGQDRSELIIPQDEASNQANVEYKRIQDEQENLITPVEPVNAGQELDNGTGIQQADGNGGEIQQGSRIGQVSGQAVPTEKVEEKIDNVEIKKLQEEIDSFDDEYNRLVDAVNKEDRKLNTPKSENEIKLNQLQDKINALIDKRNKLQEQQTPIQQSGEVGSGVDGDVPTSLRGVKYSDIIVGDKYLEDILSDNKLSEEEKQQVREVFARGVDYFKFDKEGEQKFQQKFANPEDIADIADIIEGVSLAKEAEFNFYNTKNYENVIDAVNYIANNPNEYSPKVVKAVKEIKEKLDNPSSSMNRLYAVDVMKELGITEQSAKEQPKAEAQKKVEQVSVTQKTKQPTISKTETTEQKLKNDKHDRMVGLMREYNSTPTNKKTRKSEIRQSINKLASDLGYTVKGKIGDKIDVLNAKGKVIRKINIATDEVTVTPEVIEKTKELAQGWFEWNGNELDYHIDASQLGLTWQEIRRAKADLDAGKTESTNINRVANAINEYGNMESLPLVRGFGGNYERIDVTGEDLFWANKVNETTDFLSDYDNVSESELQSLKELSESDEKEFEKYSDLYGKFTNEDGSINWEEALKYEQANGTTETTANKGAERESGGNDISNSENSQLEKEKGVNKTQNHQVYYNGKVVDMGYITNPKEQFKYASQRISDNLGTGGNTEEVGYVKTPDGKIFEVSRSNKSAKLLSGDELISAQDKFAPKDADLQSTDKKFTTITEDAFTKLLDKLKKAFPNVKVELFGKGNLEEAKKALEKYGVDIIDMLSLWHGSPHNFDRFSTDKIGTGEGSQAFGWGLYFTDLKSIAKTYAKALTKQLPSFNGKTLNILSIEKKFGKNNISSRTLDLLQKALLSVDGIATKQDLINYVNENTFDFDKERNEALLLIEGYNDGQNLRQVYKVSLHEGKTPEQYSWLVWDKPLSENNKNKIIEQGKKEGIDTSNLFGFDNNIDSKTVYDNIAFELFNDDEKEASLFLLRAGIDGIKYPAESIARGATSDNARGFNYVVFDENAIKIEEKIQFLKTKDGTIYGFKTPDGKVFINTDNLNANTPIHEYGHIWQSVFPQEFARGIELLKLSPQGQALIRQTQNNPAYKGKTISEIQAEALVTAIGNKGEAIFNSNPTLFNKFKEWLSDFFKKLGDKLGIKDLSADDKLNMFTKKVTGELLGGKELSKEVGKSDGVDLQIIGEKGATEIDKQEEVTTRLDNLYIAREMENANKTPKEIRLATGWEKGVDDLWRYEIQDFEFADKISFVNALLLGENANFKLGYVIDSENELLKSYPELSDYKIEIISDEKTQTNEAYFNPFTKTITFNSFRIKTTKQGKTANEVISESDDLRGLRRVIGHELTHAVQQIEGFAKGGSPLLFANISPDKAIAKKQLGEINQRLQKDNYTNIADRLFDLRDKQLIEKLISLPMWVSDNMERYTKLAGEVEARSVALRTMLSPQDKQDLLLSETEDVSPENQILFNDNNLSFSINPSKKIIGEAYDKAQQYLETTDFNFDTDQRDAFIEEIKNNPTLKAMFTDSQLEKIYEAQPLSAVDKVKIKYKLLVYNLKADNSANKAGLKQQQKQMVADITALIKGNLGGITGKQAERLTNLATTAVEKNSTVRLGKIINQIANLADQRTYQKAKTLYEVIKARSKRKGGVQSGKLTGVLQDFATINPLDVSDIAKYIELAEKVKQASNVVKQPTDADSDLVYDEVQAYVKAQQDEINSNAINDIVEDDAMTFFTVLDNKTKAKFGDDKTFDDLNEAQQREVFESITKDDIKKYGLTDEERDMVEAFKEIKTEQKRQDFITATYNKIGELKDLLANSVGVITQSPAEKEITDAILNVKLDNMTATEMARVLKLINGITQNNDYSGGGAFVAQQKSVEVNSKMNTLKSEIGEFRKLSEGGSKFRNFQQISVAMAKGKKLGAKLMEASGINNLMRGIAKTKTYSHNLQKAFKAEKFKSSVFEPISQMRQSIYAAVIQTKIGDDIKEAEHIARWKSIIEKNIENLRTINKDGYTEQADLLQKALDEVIGDRQQLKDIADNMSKIDSEGKRVVQFFTDNHAEQKPRFRENSLLFHNKEIEEYNSYTKLSITSLTGDTVRDTGEKLMNDARSTGITKKKSKSMIDRANYESLNDNTGLDFNFINKQMKALGDNEYDINTSADITTLANAFNSDNKQLRELLGAENFDLLKKRLQTIVGTSKYEETTVVDDLLNEATKISRTIALGSITQVLKQSTVLMSTYLNSAGKGNIKGLDFTMLFGSKRQKENLQKLFAQSEIGARRAEGAGGYYDNTTIKKNISDGNAKKILKAIGKGKDFFSDLSMYPLRSFDILAADISWITFYKKYLRDNNLVFDENNEFKNPNKEAMAYAETMVQTAQGANTEAGQAEVWGSAKGLTQLALPFMSFAVQAKARLVDNVMNIYNGDDRVEAGRDIGAYVTEQIAFNAVKLGIGTVVATQLIPALLKELGLGDDDEDTKGLSKIAKEKIELEKLRKAEQIKSSFVNNIVQDLTYGTIPMVDNMATKPAINFLYNHIFKTNTGIIPDYNRSTDFNILSGGTVGVGYNQLLNLKDDINIITDNNAFGDYKSQSQVSVFTYNGKDYTIVHNGRYTRRDMFFNNVKGRMDVSNSSVPADILKAFVENPSDFKLKEELRKTGGSQDGDLQLNLTDEQKTYAKIMLMADLLTFYGINETVFNQINNKVRGEMKKQIIKK